jgi:nucleotide-binding universal stress UspA family protein
MLSIGSATAPAMPTWSSSASTNGKARNWLIRCRLLILSSRVAVDRYLWCPRPMGPFRSRAPRLHGMAAAKPSAPYITPSRCALSQSVEIVTIIPPKAVDSTDDANHLSSHLAYHGTKLDGGVVQIGSEQEPTALRQQMEKARYDLLVMGGHSHPMWLEFIFGGTTDSVLRSSKMPVLVSH